METMECLPVAKSKGRPKTTRDDVTVKVDRKIAGRAKVLAGHRGITVAELISETLRSPLSKMWNEMIRTSEKEAIE